jgi:hypothetical protein
MSIETIVPGVYIEEDATPALSVSQGATAVPLFVGNFEPLDSTNAGKLIRISGWLEFSQLFTVNSTGYSASATITPKAADTSDDEEDPPTDPDDEEEDPPGGGTTTRAAGSETEYDVSDPKVTPNTTTLALQLYFQNGGNPCYVYALASATSSAETAGIVTALDEGDDITLLVALGDDGTYRNAVYGAVASALGQNKGYFLIADSEDGTVPTSAQGSSHVGVYYPFLSVTAGKLNEREVVITDKTDSANPVTKTLAELRQTSPVAANQLASTLSASIPTSLSIAPSAVMAGIYCKTDRERGVWKAPANVIVNGVSDVSVRVSDDKQGPMNEAGVNVIRYFSDRGIVVWGARTQQNDDNWRYVPVRRLFDTAERDIKKAMRPVVFEPNSAPTWSRVWAAIDTYLYGIWQRGGLAGNTAEEAYFVRIGKGVTMTEEDINQGKMIVQVGMAAVRPAEFIILQFTQNMSQ